MKNYINIERITKLSKVDAKVPLYQTYPESLAL